MQALTIFDVTAYGEGTGHLWHPRALSGDHDDSERFEQVLWKVFPKINPIRAIKDSDRSDRLMPMPAPLAIAPTMLPGLDSMTSPDFNAIRLQFHPKTIDYPPEFVPA